MWYLVIGVLAALVGAGLLAAYQYRRRGAPTIEAEEAAGPQRRYRVERRDRKGRVVFQWDIDDSRVASKVITLERESGRRGAAYMDEKQIREW